MFQILYVNKSYTRTAYFRPDHWAVQGTEISSRLWNGPGPGLRFCLPTGHVMDLGQVTSSSLNLFHYPPEGSRTCVLWYWADKERETIQASPVPVHSLKHSMWLPCSNSLKYHFSQHFIFPYVNVSTPFIFVTKIGFSILIKVNCLCLYYN